MSSYQKKDFQAAAILNLVVSPIAVGTLFIVMLNTYNRGTMLREYKFIVLLALVAFINVGHSTQFFYEKDDYFARNFNLFVIEMLNSSELLQPLTTWLFVWQYFDAVTSMITRPISKLVAVAL
jgi:hypothetical protein